MKSILRMFYNNFLCIFFILIYILFSFFSTPANAGNLQEAETAYNLAQGFDKKKEFSEAFKKYEQAYEAGHEQAGMIIAKRLCKGQGIDKNYQKALEIYKNLASKGNIDALFEQACIYIWYEDFPHNHTLAVELLKEAIDKGCKKQGCYGLLADFYFRGIGIEKNTKEAFRLAEEGRKIGDIVSSAMLGEMYSTSDFLDFKKSFKYFNEAALKNLVSPKIGKYYWYGLGTSRNIKKAVEYFLKENNEKGLYRAGRLREILKDSIIFSTDYMKCYEHSAQKHYAYGMAAYGRALLERGNTSGREWLMKAEQKKASAADTAWGILYIKGVKGIPQNYIRAAEYFKKAADKGEAEAQMWLGRMAWFGLGVPKDKEKALELLEFRKNSTKTILFEKNSYMQYTMGENYRPGKTAETLEESIYPKDLERSIYWHTKAAINGHKESQYFLGCYYDAINNPEGAYWLLQAAMQGHSLAQRNLATKFEIGNKGCPKNLAYAYLMYNLDAAAGNNLSKNNIWNIQKKFPEEAKKGDELTNIWIEKYPDCVDADYENHIYVRIDDIK